MKSMQRISRFARLALPGIFMLLGLATAGHAAEPAGQPAGQPAAQPDPQSGGTAPLVKDELFNGTEKFAANASDVTELTQDPSTLGMVHGHNADRAKRTVLSVVRTYSYDKPGMYKIEDVEEFRKRLNTGDWHCSVHTRDMKRGESTDICNKARTDGLVESAIITVEPKELTFIHTIKKAEGGSDDKSYLRWVPDVPVPPAASGGGASLYLAPPMDAERLRQMTRDVVRSASGMISPTFDRNMARLEAEMPMFEARMAVQQAREAAREAEREAEGKESLNDWVGRYAAAPHGAPAPVQPRIPAPPAAPHATAPPAAPKN